MSDDHASQLRTGRRCAARGSRPRPVLHAVAASRPAQTRRRRVATSRHAESPFRAPSAVVFVGLLAVTVFAAGCRDEAASDPSRVKFVWFGNETETRTIAALVQSFERENPGCRVDLTTIDWNKYTEKVVTMMLGGRSPDLARMSVQHVARFGELNALADIGPFVSSADLGGFDEARFASCRAGGRLVGLPHSSIGLVVYYNKDAFRRAGIEPPPTVHDAWSLDEFASVARRLQADGGVPYGWATFRGFFPLMPFLYMHGGRLFADDGETPQFGSAAVREAMEWFVEQHRGGVAPRSSWSAGGDNADRLFILGRCGMVIHGNWMISNYEKRIRDFEWGVTYLPRGLRAATNVGGENLVVFRTPRTKAAVRLLLYLTSPDAMRTFCSQARFIPARRDLLRDDFPYASRGDLMRAVVKQSLVFRPEWGREQSSPAFAVIADQLCARTEMAILGQTTVAEAMRDLEEDLKGLR